MDEQTFRKGIFALQTARFGEVAELMVSRLLQLGRSKSQFHDLFDESLNQRIEVKFSRVQKKAAERVGGLKSQMQLRPAASSLRKWSGRKHRWEFPMG